MTFHSSIKPDVENGKFYALAKVNLHFRSKKGNEREGIISAAFSLCTKAFFKIIYSCHNLCYNEISAVWKEKEKKSFVYPIPPFSAMYVLPWKTVLSAVLLPSWFLIRSGFEITTRDNKHSPDFHVLVVDKTTTAEFDAASIIIDLVGL